MPQERERERVEAYIYIYIGRMNNIYGRVECSLSRTTCYKK
jgi:hypothetical protein